VPVYLLDSDTVTGAFRRHPQISHRIATTPPELIWISSIAVEESVGRQINRINSIHSRKEQGLTSACVLLVKLMAHLQKFQILPYSDKAEALYRTWTPQQKRVGTNDCRIAASALVAGFTVVTCNSKDFSRLPDVGYEDWSLG
jgi:tRNA(fMet)-specific endonuclease VapC